VAFEDEPNFSHHQITVTARTQSLRLLSHLEAQEWAEISSFCFVKINSTESDSRWGFPEALQPTEV
jgi:hypothetical protein